MQYSCKSELCMAYVAHTFHISIHDLPQNIRSWSSNIFADDRINDTSGESFMETKCALQSSVYDAGRWFDNNNLSINIKKTICMLIAIEGSPNRVVLEERTLSMELSGITLGQVQTTPYLGLQLDDKLQREAHVQKLCWNISSKLPDLSRLRKELNKNTLQTVYRMHTTVYWLCRFCLGFMFRANQRLSNLNLQTSKKGCTHHHR